MRPIPGFPEYKISKRGQVWSCRMRRFIKLMRMQNDYIACCLRLPIPDGKKRQAIRYIHNLMLLTYIGPRPHRGVCRHLNGIRADNSLSNLCWGTQKENVADSIRHGTKARMFGMSNPNTKLSTKEVRLIHAMNSCGTFTQQRLADIFGVSRSQIGNIVNGLSRIMEMERI